MEVVLLCAGFIYAGALVVVVHLHPIWFRMDKIFNVFERSL